MKVISIQVGRPAPLTWGEQSVMSAFIKRPIPGPVEIHALGLVGDGQADLRVHGGIDKALYVFSRKAYADWAALRPQDALEPGAFGENLTLSDLDESDIGIGDRFALGTAEIQVTQPRFPCSKLALKFQDGAVMNVFKKFPHPGIYFRIVKPGLIHVGDTLIPIFRESVRLSILEMYNDQFNPSFGADRLDEILSLKSLPTDWQARFGARRARVNGV